MPHAAHHFASGAPGHAGAEQQNRINQMNDLKIFVPMTKIDAAQRLVFDAVPRTA
jgi:hypothetical protein